MEAATGNERRPVLLTGGTYSCRYSEQSEYDQTRLANEFSAGVILCLVNFKSNHIKIVLFAHNIQTTMTIQYMSRTDNCYEALATETPELYRLASSICNSYSYTKMRYINQLFLLFHLDLMRTVNAFFHSDRDHLTIF